jgi:hypothetical protein
MPAAATSVKSCLFGMFSDRLFGYYPFLVLVQTKNGATPPLRNMRLVDDKTVRASGQPGMTED